MAAAAAIPGPGGRLALEASTPRCGPGAGDKALDGAVRHCMLVVAIDGTMEVLEAEWRVSMLGDRGREQFSICATPGESDLRGPAVWMRTSRPLGDAIDVAAEWLRSGDWLTLRALLDVPWAAKAEGVSICKVMPLRPTNGFWPHGKGCAGVTLPLEADAEVKDATPCGGGTALKLALLGVQEPDDLDIISCTWDMA